MKENKEIQLLMLLKTTHLNQDDRVRKECLTLKKYNVSPIIVVLDNMNKRLKTKTHYEVTYYSIALRLRNIFNKGAGLLLKTIEMYFKMFWHVVKKRPKVLWVHNFELMGIIYLISLVRKVIGIKIIVWDHHEFIDHTLPITKRNTKIYKKLEKKCDYIIECNEERIEAMEELGLLSHKKKYLAIKNYPDRIFANFEKLNLPEETKNWLDEKSYLLAQGGASEGRFIENLIEVVVKTKLYKLVIVGPYSESLYNELYEKYGSLFLDYIYFHGSIPQMEMTKFIDHAAASVVLYEKSDNNRWYAAPNRLYQALSRGIPVIAGNNPTMKNAIELYGGGIVLNDDGKDISGLILAIKSLNENHESLIENAKKYKDVFVWESQFLENHLNRVIKHLSEI